MLCCAISGDGIGLNVGGSFHITDWFLLTLRVGTPYIAFGMTFQFGSL